MQIIIGSKHDVCVFNTPSIQYKAPYMCVVDANLNKSYDISDAIWDTIIQYVRAGNDFTIDMVDDATTTITDFVKTKTVVKEAV